mgnify:CR=1 FL=1
MDIASIFGDLSIPSVSFTNILSIAIFLFALIDVLGSVPIFLGFTSKGQKIHAAQAALLAFIIMVLFLFVGEGLLRLFSVDVRAFAVAGAIVIFIMSVEMTFGVEVFKNDSPSGSATIIPVVFPLLAGPATFTSLLSMRAEYSSLEIIIAVFINMIFVFLVLNNLEKVEKVFGKSGVYVLRKFFGIIIMAIAVKLFTSNFEALWSNIN